MPPESPASPRLLRPAVAYPLAFLASIIAATLGSWFTTPHLGSWYQHLQKPAFTPPNAVFPIVWPILFLLMAVAVARVASLPGRPPTQKRALVLYAAQLILNVAWSAAFFGHESPAAGMLVVVMLLAAVATTLVLFWRLDRLAGLALLPYLGWVGFAALLNAAILSLN